MTPQTAGALGSTRSAAHTWTGIGLAVATGLYYAVGFSEPTNDNFMHMAMARQMLAGDLPVRDFFDMGMTLMYGLTALAESILGHRLLAEALVVGVAAGASAYLVHKVVWLLTASGTAAAFSSVLLVLAGVRGYSYPKLVIYAAAAALWWGYVARPTAARVAAYGAWVAVAFYWRPDHGVYVAASLVLAVVAAHGLESIGVRRVCQGAAVAVACVVPLLGFVAATIGLSSYIRSGLAMTLAQHTATNDHAWPRWPIREIGDVIRLDGSEAFAPVVGLRWTADSRLSEREEILGRYGLTPIAADSPDVQRVRLSESSIPAIRGLVGEPIVEDTAGIDRGRATPTWSIWQRWRFSHWWLRFRVFGGVDDRTGAGEALAALFYGVPLVVLAGAPWLHRYLPPPVTAVRLAAFALVGLVSAVGLMRSPYDVRAVDNIVMPSILFACCAVGLWRAAAGGGRRVALTAGLAVLALLVVKSVAVAGQFETRVGQLTGQGRLPEMHEAWTSARDRLVAEPPAAYWEGRRAPVSVELARYARACVPPSDRLLVLWFAPEIYYYADRLMASRHMFFDSGYPSMEDELRLTLDKIRRTAPMLVFASDDLDTRTRALYPAVVAHVRGAYEEVGAIEDAGGVRRLILARRGVPVTGRYGTDEWPCYT